jgi:methionyl-tRNA formyltransferase
MKRIVYMGSPDFAVLPLEALLAAGYQVVGVVTQPDRQKGRGKHLAATPVKEVALKHQIPLIQPHNVNGDEAVKSIKAWHPDILVVVAFGQLLRKPLLEMAPLGAINLHASLLPAYRGAAPIHWAIIKGEKITGVTTMYMDEGMDTGDMILKAECEIGENDSTGILHDKLASLGADLLVKTLQDIENNQAQRLPQNDSLASYAPMLTKEHELIDWHKTAQEVHDQIRGLSPWPGAYTIYKNKRLKIHEAANIQWLRGEPGRVLAIDKEKGLIVSSSLGSVAIKKVQLAGKNIMDVADFCRGYSINIGDMLG